MSFPFNPLPLLVLLDFTDLGQNNFAEDGSTGDLAETALFRRAGGAIWVVARLLTAGGHRRER